MMAGIIEAPPHVRHMTGLERSYANAQFNSWGRWMEKHVEVNGYPKLDNVSAFLGGAGGGSKGHRILCLDPPEEISLTHIRICHALDEPQKHAVTLWYVVRIRPDGTAWTVEERCAVVGVNPNTLRRDLNRARYRFLGLLPPY